MYTVSAKLMKKIDTYTIEEIGIPSMVLMENAAKCVVKNIINKVDNLKECNILVLCGNGNNGGDGICVARIMHDMGYNVCVYMVSKSSNYTKETHKQIEIAQKIGVNFIPNVFNNTDNNTDINTDNNADINTDNNTDNNADIYSNNNDVALKIDLGKYDIIIDAIFGIGLTRNIEGEYYNIIHSVNEYKELNKKNFCEEEALRYNDGEYINRIINSKKIIFSIDIPSGINATTSEVMGIAIKADYTITFGLNKTGMILHPGCVYAGEVIVEDIGFPKKVYEMICKEEAYYSYNIETYKKYLPNRTIYSNKGSYGKVLIIAGSKNMAGAALMCARAAYKMGAGLVKVFTTEANRNIIQETVPEAVLITYNRFEMNEKKALKDAINQATTIVIGPGLGISSTSYDIVKYTIEYVQNKLEAKVPMIIDADAINIISQVKEEINLEDLTVGKTKATSTEETKTKELSKSGYRIKNLNNVIFTPHLKELSRLIGESIDYIQNNIYNPICLFDKVNCIDKKNEKNVLVIKDAITMTLNNKRTYINTSGNNGLATGGSGDVLSGIIAGLVATGVTNIEAASLGVYIHGLCGDEYVNDFSPYSLNATDIISYIEKVIGGISNEEVL